MNLTPDVPRATITYRVDSRPFAGRGGPWMEQWGNCDTFLTAAKYVGMADANIREHGKESAWYDLDFRIVKVTTIEEWID